MRLLLFPYLAVDDKHKPNANTWKVVSANGIWFQTHVESSCIVRIQRHPAKEAQNHGVGIVQPIHRSLSRNEGHLSQGLCTETFPKPLPLPWLPLVGRDDSLSEDKLRHIWLRSQKLRKLIAAFLDVEVIANSLYQTWDRAEDELGKIYKLSNVVHRQLIAMNLVVLNEQRCNLVGVMLISLWFPHLRREKFSRLNNVCESLF